MKLTKERSKKCPAQTIALLTNTPAQADSLLQSLERAAGGIGLHINADKTEYMSFNQRSDISTPKSGLLKLVEKFTYLGSSVTSTERDINTRLIKVWPAIDSLSVTWKSDLTDNIKCSFFQAAVMSILLYGRHLHKNTASNIEQVLEATFHKTAAVQPPTTHHENYPSQTNQTCGTLLEK